MRIPNIILSISCALLTSFGLLPANGQVPIPVSKGDLPTVEELPLCVPNAQSGYKAPHACLVKICRDNPIPPPTLILPAGTKVYVEILHSRWNETVTFVVTTTHTTTQDVPTAAVRNAIPGVQTILFNAHVEFGGTLKVTPPKGLQAFADAFAKQQQDVTDQLNGVISDLNNATAGITCLENYETLMPSHTCSQASMLTPDIPADPGPPPVPASGTFLAAKDAAVQAATTAANESAPILDISDLDSVVKTYYLTCLTYVPLLPAGQQNDARDFCRKSGERVSTKEGLIDSALTDVQKSEDSLSQAVINLTNWPGAPSKIAYYFHTTKNINLSIAVAGVEFLSKTSSPIATIAINPQANRWVVSAGLAVSNLKFNTYSNAPIFSGGTPVVSASGQSETQVVLTTASPSFVAPEALVSYNIVPSNWIGKLNKCPTGCTFLLSGGIGANLTSKTADFDTGVSFQVGGLLLTPALHFGRDTRLIDGVTVGDQLGTTPPSPLPTQNIWVRKFGFALTYVIPTP